MFPRKKHMTVLAICTSAILGGCATQQSDYTIVEMREYRVPKDNQIQLVASDMGVELGIDGIEWNEHLRPWDYRTLRSRSINITDANPQLAYIELFKDTGLLPLYNQDMNRVFVEPFATKLKETTKFEPAFEKASLVAAEQEKQIEKDALRTGELLEFQMYKGETLRSTLTGWARQAGFNKVIWYVSEQGTINKLMENNKGTFTVYERNPLSAIQALLDNINVNSNNSRISYRTFNKDGVLVIHAQNPSEPMMLLDVQSNDTQSLVAEAANAYELNLEYRAPKYRIKEPYTTVMTSRVDSSIKQLLVGYPLTVTYKESSNTIVIEPSNNE